MRATGRGALLWHVGGRVPCDKLLAAVVARRVGVRPFTATTFAKHGTTSCITAHASATYPWWEWEWAGPAHTLHARGGPDYVLNMARAPRQVFELADLWTQTVDVKDYVGFLKRLVTRPSPPARPS